MKKEYKTEDRIIPIINFPDPTEVRVTITDKHLNVFIGPRDIQFDLETGKQTASGTAMCGTTLKKKGYGEPPSKPRSDSDEGGCQT